MPLLAEHGVVTPRPLKTMLHTSIVTKPHTHPITQRVDATALTSRTLCCRLLGLLQYKTPSAALEYPLWQSGDTNDAVDAIDRDVVRSPQRATFGKLLPG